MIDQRKHISEVFSAELKKLALGDTVGYAVDGPTYVPSQQGITVGWMIMVTLKHNVLVGQDDIGVTVPVMGVLPGDDVFRKGAAYVLEEARKLRHAASQPDSNDFNQAMQKAAADNPANGLPPGLAGKGLAGLVQQP